MPATGAADIFAAFSCIGIPAGGSPTLDMYLQTSADQGGTWQDIAHVQFTNAIATNFVKIRGQRIAPQSVISAMDGVLALNRVMQGPWADRLRVKWAIALGGAIGSYAFSAGCYIK
jgi:hypothetical protein